MEFLVPLPCKISDSDWAENDISQGSNKDTDESNHSCKRCLELTISLVKHQLKTHCLYHRTFQEKILIILEDFQRQTVLMPSVGNHCEYEIFVNILKIDKIKQEIDVGETVAAELFVENLPTVFHAREREQQTKNEQPENGQDLSNEVRRPGRVSSTETIDNDSLAADTSDNGAVETRPSHDEMDDIDAMAGPPYKCSICGRTYQHKKSIARHKRTIHTASNKSATIIIDGDVQTVKYIGDSVVVQCTLCGAYLCRKSIVKHMKAKHPMAKYPWTVKSTYIKPSDIVDKYVCDYCGETYRSKIQIKRHFKSKHRTLFVRGRFPVYQCRDCDTFFTSLMAYRCHMKQYHPDKQLVKTTKPKEKNCLCDTCGQAFQSSLHLKNHTQLNHLNRRPYKCTLCDKDYPAEQQLKDHMNSHTGDRPYLCMFDSCGKTFKSKAARHSHHLTIHQNETVWKHQCEFCQKRFAMKSRLMIHRRTHTGEQPYECDICGTKFKQGANWTRHMRKMHNIEHAKRSSYVTA